MHSNLRKTYLVLVVIYIGVMVSGTLPCTRAAGGTVLYSGQIDSFIFDFDGPTNWGISVEFLWDGSSATLNAHVDTLDDYFITNLDCSFQYDAALTFCGTDGSMSGSASDSIGEDLDSERIYDFSCGSFPVSSPSGCNHFTVTLVYTLSSEVFSHSGTFSQTLPVPINPLVWVIVGIGVVLGVSIAIGYVIHKRRIATGSRPRIPDFRVPRENPSPMFTSAYTPMRTSPAPPPMPPQLRRLTPDQWRVLGNMCLRDGRLREAQQAFMMADILTVNPFAFQSDITPPLPRPSLEVGTTPREEVGAWISRLRMTAIAHGKDIPSWEALAQQYDSEHGTTHTAGEMRDLYATWARNKGIRFEE